MFNEWALFSLSIDMGFNFGMPEKSPVETSVLGTTLFRFVLFFETGRVSLYSLSYPELVL